MHTVQTKGCLWTGKAHEYKMVQQLGREEIKDIPSVFSFEIVDSSVTRLFSFSLYTSWPIATGLQACSHRVHQSLEALSYWLFPAYPLLCGAVSSVLVEHPALLSLTGCLGRAEGCGF